MKKIINQSAPVYGLLLVLVIIGLASCKKDHSEGTPVISRVRTVYKSVTDTSVIVVLTYKDSAGIVVVDTTTTMNGTPQLVNFDSTVTSGNLGNLYAIIGQNLGSPTQVLFNGFSVYFNPALGSDKSILVTIPQNTPDGPDQTNVLTVVTTHGTATFKFTVPFPPPTISTVSDYDFSAGSSISLTGVGFKTVTTIGISGTSDTAIILSQSDSTLTLQMPATTVNRANLVFIYGSGTVTSSQEFVDLDNAYQIFTDDFQNSWSDNSWSHPSGRSTTTAKTGVASYQLNYPAGAWQIEGAANWYPSFDYDPAYKYLSFWVKGGTADHNLTLVGDQMNGGYSQNTSASAFLISVPAKVWTYYKIPLGTSGASGVLNFWANGTPSKQIGFFLKGQSGDVDETMYIDDLIFVK